MEEWITKGTSMPTAKRILLVEDEDAILFAFKQVFKGNNAIVDTATTLAEAKALLDREVYAGVIADLRLTGASNLDGLEVVKYARQVQESCKIVVATAYGGEETKATVMSLGADFYFEKPVSPRVVLEKLQILGAFQP